MCIAEMQSHANHLIPLHLIVAVQLSQYNLLRAVVLQQCAASCIA
jgi:hypothetical protein